MKRTALTALRVLGRLWCRIHGAEVASDALIHGFPRIRIRPGGRIVIGAGATINAAAWANPLNDGRRTVLYAGPGAEIRLDQGSGISSSVLVACSGIHLGANSLIGAGCLICDSDMHEVPLGTGKPVATAPIRIGRGVFIGARCTLLKGVTISDGQVIGAHAVVRESVIAS